MAYAQQICTEETYNEACIVHHDMQYAVNNFMTIKEQKYSNFDILANSLTLHFVQYFIEMKYLDLSIA